MIDRWRVTLLFTALLFIVGCDSRIEPEKLSHLDSRAISTLTEKMETLIDTGQGSALKGLFSTDVEVEYMTASGNAYTANYQYVQEKANLLASHGEGYASQVFDEVILVAADEKTATIEQRKRETWLFEAPYKDITLISIQRIDWVLKNNIPQIVKLHREVLEKTVFDSLENKPEKELWRLGEFSPLSCSNNTQACQLKGQNT